MKKTKILKDGNMQLILTDDEALYLASILGNHILGGGYNRKTNDRIYGQLSSLGYLGAILPTTEKNRSQISLKNID